MLVVLVQVTVKAEMLPEFEAAILENARRARAGEPGCVRFDVTQQLDDPTRWMFYEVYRDSAAFAEHRASSHFAAYQDVATRALISKTVTHYAFKGPDPIDRERPGRR